MGSGLEGGFAGGFVGGLDGGLDGGLVGGLDGGLVGGFDGGFDGGSEGGPEGFEGEAGEIANVDLNCAEQPVMPARAAADSEKTASKEESRDRLWPAKL